MSVVDAGGAPAPARVESLLRLTRAPLPGGALVRGVSIAYLSLIVLIPLAAVVWNSPQGGLGAFWSAILDPIAVSALELTFFTSVLVVLVNSVFGVLLAWVLVADTFPGKSIVNSVIDLPFALPTIVAGLTLITLYGPNSPLGIDVAYTRVGIGLALLFVTLPFVVRSVQPVLEEVDREMEEAAAVLGAHNVAIFRRIIFPSLLPAVLSGAGLAFARALGEFGAVVLISGNIPYKTQVASLQIFGLIENDDVAGAAAVSVVLLTLSLLVLLSMSLVHRRGTKYDR